jgi:hypothetical protein
MSGPTIRPSAGLPDAHASSVTSASKVRVSGPGFGWPSESHHTAIPRPPGRTLVGRHWPQPVTCQPAPTGATVTLATPGSPPVTATNSAPVASMPASIQPWSGSQSKSGPDMASWARRAAAAGVGASSSVRVMSRTSAPNGNRPQV